MRIDIAALRLTLGYLLLAALWILFSDHLLTALGLSVTQQEHAQSLKGLLFVALTSSLLYLVLHRYALQYRRARLELASNEERLRLALDATRDGLWDWDVSRRKVFFSESYARLLGLTPQTLGDTREDWAARLHPDDMERAAYAQHRVQRTALRQHLSPAPCRWQLSLDSLARSPAA